MNFKQFFEIADLSSRPTTGISFRQEELSANGIYYDNYSYNFKVGNEFFGLDISHWQQQLVKSESKFVQALRDLGANDAKLKSYFSYIYNISFIGPNGYKATYNNNNAAAVYSKILLAIKSFMSDHEVEGVVFSAYDEAMALVYHRFVKNFTNFEIVDNNLGLYLDKEIVEIILSDYPMMSKVISSSKEHYHKELGDLRVSKVQNRHKALLSREMINKFIVFKRLGRVKVGATKSYNRSNGKLSVIYLNDYNRLDTANVEIDNVDRLSNHPELRSDYEKLHDALQKIGNFGDFSNYSVY